MIDQDLTSARAAVEGILDALNIARVVYVDDYNAMPPTIEDTIAAALSIDTTGLQSLFPELGESLPDDHEIVRSMIRTVWPTLKTNIQYERSKAIIHAAEQHDGHETDDAANIAVLGQLIPEGRLVSLSPSEWEMQQEELLKQVQIDRALFVFDRDFSRTGGDPDGGIKIIASLLARNDTEGVLCGLLTHTVTPKTQPEQWAELSNTHRIPMDRFVVIPKLHLSKAPMLFAQMLKYAALAPEFSELKGKAQHIIQRATYAAAAKVDQVRIHDLDHIVFKTSVDEGMWEPEMLFRLHSLFHRLEARQLAHMGGDLEKLAERMRIVSGIPTECGECAPPSIAWQLQRQELYELDEHVNRYHLPIEVGDIFERTGSSSQKRYILLAQPCDLMVRRNGERQPELGRVPLVELVVANERPQYAEEMPCFGQSPSERWYVKMRMVHYVQPCILDLCVFNQKGNSELPLHGDCPSAIRPTWKNRFKVLSKRVEKIVRKADLLAPSADDHPAAAQLKRQLSSDIDGMFFSDDLFKGRLTSKNGSRIVQYNCRRIGRVSRARAMGLLLSYTGTIGRPAYDRDFAVLPQDSPRVTNSGSPDANMA